MKIIICALIGCVLVASSARAQIGPDQFAREHFKLPTQTERNVADWASTIAAGWALAAPCLQDSSNRNWHCVKKEALQVGLGVVIAEASKHFIHRDRPDGSDKKSFFSEHTELVCAVSVGTKNWYLCPAVAMGRIAADKHWATDTLVGGFVGGAVLSGQVTWVF